MGVIVKSFVKTTYEVKKYKLLLRDIHSRRGMQNTKFSDTFKNSTFNHVLSDVR